MHVVLSLLLDATLLTLCVPGKCLNRILKIRKHLCYRVLLKHQGYLLSQFLYFLGPLKRSYFPWGRLIKRNMYPFATVRIVICFHPSKNRLSCPPTGTGCGGNMPSSSDCFLFLLPLPPRDFLWRGASSWLWTSRLLEGP